MLVMAVVICICLIVGLGYLSFGDSVIKRPVKIESEYKDEIKTISPEKTIFFGEMGLDDFTCTGLTYYFSDDSIWIGDYGAIDNTATRHPRIIEIDKGCTHLLKQLMLDEILNTSQDLQGIAYDSKDNCLWLAVKNQIIEINKDGNVQKKIDIEKYAKYGFNGVSYNEIDDTLWIVCEESFLLHLSKSGSVIDKYSFNYSSQDHVCTDGVFLYITVGSDYSGMNNYICKVSMDNARIVSLYRLSGSNAIEGICNVDKSIIIANDGFFHSDIIGHSYLSFYSNKNIIQ